LLPDAIIPIIGIFIGDQINGEEQSKWYHDLWKM